MKIIEDKDCLYDRCYNCGQKFIYDFYFCTTSGNFVCPGCILDAILALLKKAIDENVILKGLWRRSVVLRVNDLIEILCKITDNFTLLNAASFKENVFRQ